MNALGEPAIVFNREPERLYPQTALAGHVLGWTDFDGRGVAGMERVLEDRLSDPGAARHAGRAVDRQPGPGGAWRAELGAAMTKLSAEGAAGIVLDVRTGEVIAMASLPQLQPQRGRPQRRRRPRFNRATMGVYELGSTFKPITVAMAMDAGT